MKKTVLLLIVILLLAGCTKNSSAAHSDRVISDEEMADIVKQYPEIKPYRGLYYGADLNDDGIEEIYITPCGSGIPFTYILEYYNPATDTFGTFEEDGKDYWFFIYKGNLYVGSPSDEKMLIYDNIESVYIPYLENGELKLKRADESLEKEIFKSDIEDIAPMITLVRIR